MATVSPPTKSPASFLARIFGRPTNGGGDSLVGPIRGELFGAERLAEHARAVARRQRLLPPETRRDIEPLLGRLADTRRILDEARATLTAAAERELDVSPAGDWLLDNYYVVQEHLREIQASMPKGYYRELPKLASGTLAGYPRVYELAIELIAHTEGHVDLDNIELFVRAFQRGASLNMGELWAVPTMLRLGLVENIRRMTLRTVQRLQEVATADAWAARLREATEAAGRPLADELPAFVADHPPFTPTFVTRFLQQIRNYQTASTPLVWLEQWITEESGLGAEDAVAQANQRLALTQVIIANSITSLRTIARVDWRKFVETQSATDATLRRDPSGDYPQMTFGTRDHYRHVVERIAKVTRRPEEEVAAGALALAESARDTDGNDPRRAHVGYYLVEDGRRTLEQMFGYRPPLQEAMHRWVLRHPNIVYFGSIAVATALALSVVFDLIRPTSLGGSIAVFLLALIPANEVAISAVNQLATFLMPPRTLPKLEFRDEGIPEEYRTVVVVPTLFGSVDAVREALDHLEVQFLANRDPRLHFAILSDFTDAHTETRETDEPILAAATTGIHALNEKYAGHADEIFYLFHRPRLWNPKQNVWMGWERKRGKLAEFNQFLRGGAQRAFSTIVGDVDLLRGARYVITLDSDTVLPRDAAQLLVGTLAHPLNRAAYDPVVGRIVRGYGILQPRVGVSLISAHRSYFAAIHSGHPGVDPYTTAVSDVYQDLYAEGSFTGKGIYDVDAFERATHGRFPENTLLSHDLIEGAYSRAALATDVELYDDYPTRYLTFTRRKHRWIRGDWQLLRWLGGTVPGPVGPTPNRLSTISRWKIFDNLRRSVVEIAQLLLLFAGWTVLPGSATAWTLIGVGAVAFPWGFSLFLAIIRPPLDKSWRAYYAAVARDAFTSLQQILLAIVFLPHQAFVSADAIVRTLGRLFFTKRNLLEWQTASQVERVVSSSKWEVRRRMWPGIGGALLLLAAFIAVGLARYGGWNENLAPAAMRPHELPAVLMGLLLVGSWVGSPRIAYALSAPAVRRELRLSADERRRAYRYALLHWRFFDRFVTAQSQWLAPDNFQEDPQPVVAARTSPTNIGLQLLSIVTAYDLGFLTSAKMIERLELVFRSLERMRRFRGHFYNWYDLRDLRVLEPAYISTVDSGNLAGHLLALKQACLGAPDDPVFSARVYDAVQAALILANDTLRDAASSGSIATPAEWQATGEAGTLVRAALADVARARVSTEPTLALRGLAGRIGEADRRLRAVTGSAEEGVVDTAADPFPEPLAEPLHWLAWAHSVIDRILAELRTIGASGAAPVPTLREAAATSPYASEQIARLQAIADRAHDYAMEMDFRFLYDERRKLFAIGYQQSNGALDNSFYDLLASESRLASFVAVAKDDVSPEHWFRLGRGLTATAGATALVSWSGSMFEYLMPLLVMRSFPYTLLDQTYRGAVKRQVAYGVERHTPWGVSESAYNVRDRNQTYQYRAFGVPDLALKRGLSKDLVVAPYATVLALMVEPHVAMRNLDTLEREGTLGPYGFRDAIDYTRPVSPRRGAVVAAFMAHHIGMALVALDNALSDSAWQARFHADPIVRSAELMLFERIPRRLVLAQAQPSEFDDARRRPETEKPAALDVETAATPEPRVALLGQTPYTVMVTNSGAGSARYEQLAVTRWRTDGTRDNSGQWCYIKDVTKGRVWSAAYQPVCVTPDWYNATLATDRVVFHRRDRDIETVCEVTVVPDDRAEVRRVTLTNHSEEVRELELTSYGEIVLAPASTEQAHPAFANLFVQTEWLSNQCAILARRRPRAATEQTLWLAHVAAASGDARQVTCETDRARFIGRGRSARNPVALDDGAELSGTVGAVLDPIFALRTRVRIRPGHSAQVAFTTLVADDRERVLQLADRYNDDYSAQRALDLAWTQTQVGLRDFGITPADARLYQQLAGYLLYPHPAMRSPQREMQENRKGQETLWSHGLSGDHPILLATIESANGLPSVRELLRAHHYWRLKGMAVDLVLLNVHPPSYLQELQEQLAATVAGSSESALVDKPGGVFIRRRDLISVEDLSLIRTTARVHVNCDGVGLGELLDLPDSLVERAPPFEPRTLAEPSAPSRSPVIAAVGAALGVVASASGSAQPGSSGGRATGSYTMPSAASAASSPSPRSIASDRRPAPVADPPPEPLAFHNGIGGFAADGSYEIRLGGEGLPPAPWANVIANAHGGFLVTESGGGCTWAENSYFYRLTPWFNDPVSDPSGDVLYLRDDDSGEIWTPTPTPVRHRASYRVRHGAGFSSFAHTHSAIETELTLGVAEHEAVKISRLRVTNGGTGPRRLSITSYVEWTLGVLREQTQHQVRTRFDHESGAIFAQNFYNPEFARLVAFSWISEPVTSFTGDRREFIGRNGTPAEPAGLSFAHLGEVTGVGIDPCAALQCAITLAPGETRELVALLGAAESDTQARQLIATLAEDGAAVREAQTTMQRWRERLSTVTVRTPAPAFDAIVNGWLLYQALACRFWGRTALYQSSGAYGFRDQLQDVTAFVYAEPGLAREHIVRAAGRQFVEGDVQHWWHPQSGRGVRTRFSDDLAWLPFVVDHYVSTTGDTSVLDETAPYLTMRLLDPDEHEVYDRPDISPESGSVYDHCVRALRKACTTGEHGLPLIGIGDWNDGMNRVGVGGKGESVWLAWFLITTLRRFAERSDSRDDRITAAEFRRQADAYTAAVEATAWDGAWYRRAYFDDGTPLGSASSEECKIDAIAQSWSVISGAADPQRAEQAMRALDEHLVREDARLIMLLTPAFDKTSHDPGYIKGYLPGVRENGAQYTHAALWTVLATALQGNGDRAFHLFDLLNPITHASSPEDVHRYKVEPYVVAADVYTAEGHVGRGGWTWYTGSASWMYRVALEGILGFEKNGATLVVDPCIPSAWDGFELEYRYGSSTYAVSVRNPTHVSYGVRHVIVDGVEVPHGVVPLEDDGRRREVVIELG